MFAHSLALALASLLLDVQPNPSTQKPQIVNDDRDVIQSALLEHFYPWSNEFSTTKYSVLRVRFGDWDQKRLKEGRLPFKKRIDELVRSVHATVNQNGFDRDWAKSELAIAQNFEAIGNRKWNGKAYRPPAVVAFDKMAWNPRIKLTRASIPSYDGVSYGLDRPSYSPDGSVAFVRITVYHFHFDYYTYLMQRQPSGWVTVAIKEDHFI